MGKIGIVTYHAAYNFGSTLQAYATQEAVNALGYDCQIINYRMPEQKYYYGRNIRLKYGIKAAIKDILQLQHYKERKIRSNAYEGFISSYMKLSPEFSEPSDVCNYWDKYDVIISGSDQIWNKHSNELDRVDWKYMDPYTLSGYKGKKISYASSIGSMTENGDIQRLAERIKDFRYISFREEKTANDFSKILGRNVESVLDPTFLLTADDWVNNLELKRTEDDFILYYSLSGIKGHKDKLTILSRLSERMNTKIVVVTPLVNVPGIYNGLEFHPEFSTFDFLQAIYNAKTIITDSYHGSILSVNLKKDVYSICGENVSDFRKTDIYNRLGLNNRIISGLSDEKLMHEPSIDYKVINERLQVMKKHSLDYLSNALQ